KKRAYEIARYVLPVATHAYLYHSVSGLTLIRYRRLCRIFDTPFEQAYVVDRMIEEVLKVDPDFGKDLKDPMPLEETPEYAFFESRHLNGNRFRDAKTFLREFDGSLEGHVSKLVDYKQNAETVFAQAVRSTLGATREALSDGDAINLMMNPEK